MTPDLIFLVDRVLQEQHRLEAEEEIAEQGFLQAQQLLNESAARLMRLKKQKRFLVSKGKEMVRRNLADLDALEEEERLEEAERLRGEESPMHSLENGGGVLDWSTLDLSGGDPRVLADPGSSGGIVEQGVGSVGGV